VLQEVSVPALFGINNDQKPRSGEKMKRTSTVALILILIVMVFSELSNTFSTVFLRPKTIEIPFSISFAAPEFSNISGYCKIGISGCGMTSYLGKPVLPTRIVSVLIPPDGELESIDMLSMDSDTMKVEGMIIPAQHPVAVGSYELPAFVEPDRTVYESEKAYPGFLFEDMSVQWLQGYKILNIRVYPVQYSPKNGVIAFYKTMEFVLKVSLTGSSPSRSTFSDAKTMISEVVVNPEKADVWVAPSAVAPLTSTVDYVIITSTAFQDEFQALANWKVNKGLSAGVYNTTWIYSNYAGVDNQAKIRNFTFNMYNNCGTRYVLLGGDYDVVPPRYVYMQGELDYSQEGGGGLGRQYKPTDYYYACLDGNWDPDGDGKYLEQLDLSPVDGYPETCAEPIPDFYPEVYVGRLPARTEAEAQFLASRTISYESSPPTGDWRNKALLLGAISNYQNEDRSGRYKTDGAMEQEYVRQIYLDPRGYSTTTMYEKQGLDPSTVSCTYWLNQSNVQSSWSSGYYLVSSAGHGDVQTQDRKIWSSDDGDGVPESSEMSWIHFVDSTSMTLTNGGKLPQVYIDSCLTGKFDDTVSNCVAEWLLKLGGGGAVAVTAASRISYYISGWMKGDGFNQELLCLYWEEFFNATNGCRPGRAMYWSKTDYWQMGFDMTGYESKKNLLIYNLLGDPDLQLDVHARAHDLAVYLEAPATIQLGDSTVLNATVRNEGINDEIDVRLYFIINDTVVNSVTLSELLAGTSHTINYSWTPTIKAPYNITAYALPVPGETYTENNIVTDIVHVFYMRMYLPHEWIGGGVPMGWHADDASWNYTLPFDFPLCGTYYRTIYVSSNGLITFLGPNSSFSNSISGLASKLAIAPAWDDWKTYDPYDIYVWKNSTCVGIRWYAQAFGTGVNANFEAILSADGLIQFNYGAATGPVSATIGVSNGMGGILAEDATNLNYLNTIVFTPFARAPEPVLACFEATFRSKPSNTVYFAPTGNIYDDSTLYAFYAYKANPQVIAPPTQNPASNNTLDPDGKPLFTENIITFGGRVANRMVRYYEDAGIARVAFLDNGTHYVFSNVSNAVYLYAVNKAAYNSANKDYFVLQTYKDGDRYVLSEWGINAEGTYAGGVCFIDIIIPNIGNYTNQYYIYSWTDTNNDTRPQREEIALVTSGN